LGKIRDARQSKGLTTHQVAEYISSTDRVVNMWEAKDTVPFLRPALLLSKLYGIPVKEMCAWEDGDNSLKVPRCQS